MKISLPEAAQDVEMTNYFRSKSKANLCQIIPSLVRLRDKWYSLFDSISTREAVKMFEVKVQVQDGIPVISVKGDIYGEKDARCIKKAALDQIDEGHRKLIIDLTLATHIESLGLGVLIGILKRLREREGRLALIRTEGSVVSNIIRLTGLDIIFDSFKTIDEAVEALRAEL